MPEHMKTYVRPLLLALAALGFAASVAALYVHYRLNTDPGYASFCDISETVGCQQVFQSSYGSVLGIPVAAGGAIWSSLVLLLAFFGMRKPASPKLRSSEGGSELARPKGRHQGVPADPKERHQGVPGDSVAGYIFLLATAGLAAVFYFAYASFFVLGQACPLCMTMYASVIGVFLVSAGAAGSLKTASRDLGRDLAALPRSQTGTTVAVSWLAASIAVLVLFPREQALGIPEPSVASSDPDVPIETLTPEQLAEWEKFLDSAPLTAEMQPSGDVKVRLVKFNDYQCPYCRQTWALYRGIIAKYEAAYPDAFEYESRDFPLEAECGLGGGHSMSCEAAAAARMARMHDKGREMEAWLFEHQSFEMTRDDVKKGLAEVVEAVDFESEYAKMLPGIREVVQLAEKVGVNSTPTFFINGIRLDALRPAYFDATIAWALRKAGVTS
jgi:uncharacterized membrane protein